MLLSAGNGKLPMDVTLYHGSTTTLQGELRVAGVKVTIEGIVANVENMTIYDGGKTCALTLSQLQWH